MSSKWIIDSYAHYIVILSSKTILFISESAFWLFSKYTHSFSFSYHLVISYGFYSNQIFNYHKHIYFIVSQIILKSTEWMEE